MRKYLLYPSTSDDTARDCLAAPGTLESLPTALRLVIEQEQDVRLTYADCLFSC